MKKLERQEMKNLKGGMDELDDDSGPRCTSCSSDLECRPTAPECRESPSCPLLSKVCAKRHWC